MHNWRLLILLIPSLLQPILSEHSYIYGRQYCIHSSRSRADERFLHGKHRLGQPTSNGERLVDQRPTDQFGIRRYRHDIRDVEPRSLSSEQHLEHSIIASDDRSPVVDVRRDRTIKDVGRDFQREIVREQNYKDFRNARNIATSFYARLPNEDRERENRKHSGRRFDTRGSNILHSHQELPERIGKSNVERKNYVLTRNFRNEHARNRQTRNLNLQADNVPQHSRNTDSLERNIRKRDLDRDFNRDVARIQTPTDLRRERVNVRNNERDENERARNRNIVHNQHRVNSDIRNELENRDNNERYSRVNVRERTIVSIEDVNRQFHVRQISDRQVISGQDTAPSPLERDNRQNGGRYIFPNKKSNIILNIDRTVERENERTLRRIIRERTASTERFVRQSDDSMITDVRRVLNREEINRNKPDVHTATRNGRMYSKNNIRERDISMERDMHRSDTRKINTHNAEKREERTDLRTKRTEIKNAERPARDNYRDESYYREIRQYHAERISEKQLTPRRVEPNNNIRYEHTDNRNSERYSRDINSDRSISVDREARKLDSRLALDLSTGRSHNERNLNARVERIRTRNDEKYSREHSRERAVSNEDDVRLTESKRVSDVRSRESRSLADLNASVRDDGTNIRNINRYSRGNIYRTSPLVEPNHLREKRMLRSHIVRNNRNVQNIRSDIRNSERYSRENVYVDREIRRPDVSRIIDENDADNHNERNIRVRVERTDVRYTGRYGKDTKRERTLSLDRDVHGRDMTINDLTHRNVRNTNRDQQRTDRRYSNDNTRGRSVFVDREVRDLDVRRVTDLENINLDHRNREERNMYVRNNRYGVRDPERYLRDVTHERAILMERSENDRQSRTMRIENRQIARGNQVQRDRSTRVNNRELREINERRILRNRLTNNEDNRDFRDFTHERTSVTVERDRTVDNGKLQDLRHLTSTQRRTERDQIRNRDNLSTSPRFTRNHRISQEQIHNTDYVRSSDTHVYESRRATAMRRSTLDLYREREIGIREGYRNSRNIDLRRDVFRQNSEFTNALRTVVRSEPTVSMMKPIEKQFNAMFYWQYIFYTIQGIYIFGVLVQVFKEKEHSKTSSMGWLIPTRPVKVD